jgi:hypothetical protein
VIAGNFDVNVKNLENTATETKAILKNSGPYPQGAEITAIVSDGGKCAEITPTTKTIEFKLSQKGQLSVNIRHPNQFIDKKATQEFAKKLFRLFANNETLTNTNFNRDKIYILGPGPIMNL